MSRTAIVGSCITRDLWPIRGDAQADLLYVSRTSLATLFTPALPAFRPLETPPPPLGPYQHRAMVADLQATALARLAAFRPTHLILDLIDERFDLLAVGDSRVTDSWELRASGYLDQPVFASARPIPRLSPACEALWRQGAADFLALIRGTRLRDARLILHSARWAAPAPPDFEILPGRAGDPAAHNALLARYEDYLLQLAPEMVVVAAPDFRRADPDHVWGLSPFHYTADYYAEITRQLAALGLEINAT
ncbi:DUF6270 domain-containing protein [Phenylobacterium immobile]|uniref:DUF6270 domain-containing protein n=1 Tax=Phenylobacterium immobile TaxID=21 RepID=UPI000B18A227|nr:DUF6270 domain-containing protein [Phenylobacterium immobile]